MITVGKPQHTSTVCLTCASPEGVQQVTFDMTAVHSQSIHLCAGCRRVLVVACDGVARDDLHEQFLHWRDIEPADACGTCNGSGHRAYGSTTTWRGGVGGQMATRDVCDRCWGTGDRYRPGCDLRKLRAEEAKRVAEAAVDALARSCGATLRTSGPAVLKIAETLRTAAKKRNADGIWVLAEVAAGLQRGRGVYGELRIDSDTRDHDREALDEVRDGLVYAAIAAIKRRRAAGKEGR